MNRFEKENYEFSFQHVQLRWIENMYRREKKIKKEENKGGELCESIWVEKESGEEETMPCEDLGLQ